LGLNQYRSTLQGSGISIPNFKPQIEFGAITERTFGAIGNSTGLQKSADSLSDGQAGTPCI
jgi:hypothetical protein